MAGKHPSQVRRRRASSGKLTPGQMQFIDEFMVDKVAAAAAVRAGLAPGSGCAMLKLPHVRKEIARRDEMARERLQISADRVATELARIAFSNVGGIVEWETIEHTAVDPLTGRVYVARKEQVLRLKDSAELTEAQLAAVSEIRQTKHGLVLKFHDKKGALDSLAKHLGMFQDEIEIKIPVKFEIVGAPPRKAIGAPVIDATAREVG